MNAADESGLLPGQLSWGLLKVPGGAAIINHYAEIIITKDMNNCCHQLVN